MKETNERVLELVLAVYRVTKLFPEGEVLIGQIRETANRILNELILGNQKESIQQIEVLLNYFKIAQAENWIKSINFAILIREYNQLLEEIKLIKNPISQKQVRKIDGLNKRQEKILNYIKNKNFVKLGELCVLFPKSSPRTIRKDLNEMAKRKILFQQGRGRSSIYKINKVYNKA